MRGGCAFGVAGDANQPNTFYFGSVGGGVSKTENSGRTWSPISDRGIPIGSIGAIAVAPSDANLIYVGTGESDIRSHNSDGIGMFKSTDAGKTWTHIGLQNTHAGGRTWQNAVSGIPEGAYVNSVKQDPQTKGLLYAATELRVYLSFNDGDHWQRCRTTCR
jgi:photosystem II stability/assembly factor-like uncharacterized protein